MSIHFDDRVKRKNKLEFLVDDDQTNRIIQISVMIESITSTDLVKRRKRENRFIRKNKKNENEVQRTEQKKDLFEYVCVSAD